MDVKGKVAVVTGAASGMGLAMAQTFADSGMAVVLADIEEAALEAAVNELSAGGHKAIGVRTDVSKLSDVQALADATLKEFGAVHVLCNNAGVGVGAPVGNTSIADWKWTLDIDLWGPIYGVETFLPLIEEQGEGHINSTASMAGLYAGASLGAYNVAKHGVVALMASLERDLRWRESKVRASVLCPGPINTKIVDSERNRDPDDAANHVDSEQGQKFWEFLTRTLANGMDPAEVGPMVLDAVINDKFWILTHPEMGEIAINQARAMLDDQHLTR
ncbi:MAG: 3-oxoacyl-ACP reductase [Acidimicrobiaceae bacterium]|nr:3-oxoacyl-ACP reductase [Acidimicrobiaceae bacterium]MBE08015.1 3-oxoacyl-ACP reductase [Acidimicrobiaceae bacterium]|tara:strand:- start:383 stop:1207 length:825 start_codon:yes stop_codon:yes gene_type:complete